MTRKRKETAMQADVSSLAVLSRANEHTVWHYKTEDHSFDDVMENRYFNSAADRLRTGDIIHVLIKQKNGTALVKTIYVYCFIDNDHVMVSPLGECPRKAIPIVPDFLCQMSFFPWDDHLELQSGDVLIGNNGKRYVFSKILASIKCPIGTEKSFETFTRSGWFALEHEGQRDQLHIVRVERDGVTIAEGQIYNDGER